MCHDGDRSFPPDRGELTEPVRIALGDGTALPGVLQRPSSQRGEPVLLLTDIYGPIPFYVGLAGALADAGYPTLVVDLFFRAGALEQVDRDHALARARTVSQRRTLADLDSALSWLVGGSEGPAGVLGFCLGGSLALNLAATRKGLAIVSYYGFPAGVPGTDPAPAPRDIVADIDAPVLAFWGEEDYMGMDDVRRFCADLQARRDDAEAHLYPGVGHGFLSGLAGGEPAARDSWDRTLAFLADRGR